MMYIENRFEKSILIAMFWHIICFSSVSFTFFVHPKTVYKSMKIVFLKPLLTKTDFYLENSYKDRRKHSPRLDTYLKQISKPLHLSLEQNFSSADKPPITIDSFRDKPHILRHTFISALITKTEQRELYRPPMMGRSLYFQDRPMIGIELNYRLSNSGRPMFVQRLISSGNLEADLLMMNYLKRWIFFRTKENSDFNNIKFELSDFLNN